jgi:tRNA dimethylallyltransferase
MASSARPPLVLLLGPTAVGKTEISIPLAERLDGELVSADSRLFYRGLDIGTAKPSHSDRARVPHHLIDIADPDETVSLADFQGVAKLTVRQIHARGRLPVLVGGTGQYVRAITEGWQLPYVKPHPRLRLQLEAISHGRGAAWLHERLAHLDPEAAQSIEPANARRTIRALEVIFTSGHKFSELRQRGDSPFRVIAVGLRRPRQELYARVDTRIEDMFRAGFLREVEELLAKGYSPDLPSLSAIGYRECIKVLDGRLQLEDAKREIRRGTRLFVRRQSNWFKETDPDIKWFDLPAPDILDNIESHIRAAVRG